MSSALELLPFVVAGCSAGCSGCGAGAGSGVAVTVGSGDSTFTAGAGCGCVVLPVAGALFLLA